MFTGLVEALGTLRGAEPRGDGARLTIGAGGLEGIAIGDSVAVNGCCLTAVAVGAGTLAVDAVPETLRRTTLGALAAGAPVNLERSLRLDARLGGHLVQGHVDGVGQVVEVRAEGEGRRIGFEVPDALARFVAEKGSIAIDGVSLTVAAVRGARCEVAFIPHTLAATIAGSYAPGDRVNIEVDVIARYVARLVAAEEEAS